MCVAVSSSHIVSAVPSFSGGGLLTLLRCSNVESFPQAAVLHKWLWSGVPPIECSPSGTDCSSVGPPRGHKSCSKPVPVWAPLSMGLQVLPEAFSSTGSPQGHSLLCASPCSGVGSFMGCRWRSAPLCTSMGCRGTACLTMVFINGFRGKCLPWCLEYLLPLLPH